MYKWELDSAARTRKASVRDAWEQITPEWLFLGSFAALILIGALGLRFVPFFYAGENRPLGIVDALFTATSAVCVTGLIVVDTATYFSIWGKLWLLLLIQVGGLGIITFTTVLIAAMGGRPSLRQEAITSGTREAVPTIDYRGLTRHVILFTLGFELIGFLVLAALWVPRFGPIRGVGHAAFHSVSAFCNAGFSTFSDSMVRFQTWPLTLVTIMGLIVVGGLGFLTLEEMYTFVKARRARRGFRMSLHSKIVLVMTALLVLSGWLFFALLEWGNTLSGMSTGAKLINALFMSVTPRTAGFNNINYVQATVGANFLTILLMFIGGAPGSTAGGLKVTTVALPGLLAWSRIRGQGVTSFLKRTVPEETIQRAVGLIVLGFALVTGCILLVVISEGSSPDRFLDYMFESVSAFDTVGLSRDTTPGLGAFGKLVMVVLMFLGRVGLPTVASALTVAAYRPLGEFRYAQEDVVIG
ncbi:potassium transporter TrkH [Tautonia sociabilis]|uniref:Potassium transporter TrkH n=1 Tax=Tautonia sociabilis TaxID=2080755 RepID=A0A432MJ58_9BACT|nr:potassium transporter TrkH [Tautonia sociabilis]